MGKHMDDIVTWSEKYATGVKLIDGQHKELVDLTNKLYRACLVVGDQTVFKEAMTHMIDYVKFHFTAESELLEQINYPKLSEHNKEHENLTNNILGAVKDYNAGNEFVPSIFAQTLVDWVFGHIGVSDKAYAAYIVEQKKKGLLGDVVMS